MSNLVPVTEITRDRELFIRERLKGAKPLVAASTMDAIVIVTESAGIRKKIWPVSKRIAFGAIGVFPSFKGGESQKGLQDVAEYLATSTAMAYSEEDVWADDLAIALSNMVREIFSNYRMLPLCVEFLLAEINREPAHDKLIRIFPNGIPEETHDSHIILGEDGEKLDKEITKLLKNARTKFENMSADRAVDLIIEAMLEVRKTTAPAPEEKKVRFVRFEIGVLKRGACDEKFEKLSKEIPITQKKGVSHEA